MTPIYITLDGKGLTRTEFEITRLTVMGKFRKEIADMLGLERGTIDNNYHVLYRLVGVNNAAGLVAWACEHGFHSDGTFTPPDETPPHPLQQAERTRNQRGRNRKGSSDGVKGKPSSE